MVFFCNLKVDYRIQDWWYADVVNFAGGKELYIAECDGFLNTFKNICEYFTARIWFIG